MGACWIIEFGPQFSQFSRDLGGSEAINMQVHLSQQGRRLLSYQGKKTPQNISFPKIHPF